MTTSARVRSSEATAVAIHPITGDPIFCFARPSDPLPERYRRLGYEKRQFHSIHELRRWCASKGLTNDITDFDQPHEGFMEAAQREQEEADRRWRQEYARERALAAKALGVGQYKVRIG